MSILSDYNKVVNSGSYEIPNQMASTKTKQTKKWQEGTMDYFVSSIYSQTNTKRKSPDEMRENINMVNSCLDVEDLRKSFDPLSLDEGENADNLPIKEQFYNIVNNPLRTLFGEEFKRRSDIRAIVVNQFAINKKDEEFTERLMTYLQEQAKAESIDEEDFKKNMQDLDKFAKYDLQSAHEKMANEIIQVIANNRHINVKRKFNDAFKSLNTVAEAVVRVGKKGKEPWLYSVDSSNFTVLGLGNSNYIHDGWAWIEYEYMSPNKIVEEFNRELKEFEIKKLIERDDSYYAGHITPLSSGFIQEGGEVVIGDNRGAIASNGAMMTIDGSYTDDDKWVDDNGNIRVARAQWLSLRKIGELKYYDEQGEEQKMFVDEYHPINIDKGEEVEWFYINELWEGVKIAYDIYLGIKPSDVQIRSLINPAIVRPHYVGVISSFLGGKARCIIDDIKPYQHDFNIWYIKLKQKWLQHIGKAAVIDVSRIPSTMGTDEWFRWVRMFGISFENPFEESKKGLIAGHMQQTSRNIDLSHAEEINTAIQMLSWIEGMVNKIAAVPESRQGDMTGNEGLGVSQDATMRSSTQTEDVFQLHEDLKAFTYEILIEYTKVLWEDEKGKRQYQLDAMSNYIIDIDGAVLNEAEYGIQITNSTRVYEMENTLKQLAHAGMQTGTLTLHDVAQMQLATSPSEMLRALDQAEEKRLKQQQETERLKSESAQQQQEAAFEFEKTKHAMEMEKINTKGDIDIKIKQMDIDNSVNQDAFKQMSEDDNNNGIEDQIELDKENIKAALKKQEIASDEKMFYAELKQKKELELTKLKTQEKIAKENAIKSAKKASS